MANTVGDTGWQVLFEFSLSGAPGEFELVANRLSRMASRLDFSSSLVAQLETALANAILQAHRRELPGAPVLVQVKIPAVAGGVRGTKHSYISPGPGVASGLPVGVEAHQVGGWGFFLVQKMLHEAQDTIDQAVPLIELFLYLEGAVDAPMGE